MNFFYQSYKTLAYIILLVLALFLLFVVILLFYIREMNGN